MIFLAVLLALEVYLSSFKFYLPLIFAPDGGLLKYLGEAKIKGRLGCLFSIKELNSNGNTKMQDMHYSSMKMISSSLVSEG